MSINLYILRRERIQLVTEVFQVKYTESRHSVYYAVKNRHFLRKIFSGLFRAT